MSEAKLGDKGQIKLQVQKPLFLPLDALMYWEQETSQYFFITLDFHYLQ